MVVPALLRKMALKSRGVVSSLLDMAHRMLQRSRCSDLAAEHPEWACLPDLKGPLVSLSSVAVGQGTAFQQIEPGSDQHRQLTLRENTAIARTIATHWDKWMLIAGERPDFAAYCRAEDRWTDEAANSSELYAYDFVPVPCHPRTNVPDRVQTQGQRVAGPNLLQVEAAPGDSSALWATLPFGFWDMLINFIQVVEANIFRTTSEKSARNNWSSTRYYNFVHSRLEALIGQSNADIGLQTERVRRVREHGCAAECLLYLLQSGERSAALVITDARVLRGVLAKNDELQDITTLAEALIDITLLDGALSAPQALVRRKELDAALFALHPDLVKRLEHIKQQFDYVPDLRGSVPFSEEVRRLYANICQDPDVFKRLGLDTNRAPHQVTVHFHPSTKWRAAMFRTMFGPTSAALFNFAATDPGFNIVEMITQLYPYVVFAVGDGAHKHISRVSRRR